VGNPAGPPFMVNLVGHYMMSEIEDLKELIKKTEIILNESRENYKKNPDQYSAKLLLLSTENYLADLLKRLDKMLPS